MAKRRSNDAAKVKEAASGRWIEILEAVGGIPRDYLSGKHSPCPKCGGKDRFRLIDSEAGAVLCNQCFSSRNGDGFAAIEWSKGWNFSTTLAEIAGFLGVEIKTKAKKEDTVDPDEQLKWIDGDKFFDRFATLYALRKSGVRPEGLRAAGARLAEYRGSFTVFALPVWGADLDVADPVGWIVFEATGGALPKRNADGSTEWISKPKLTFGSKAGLVGDLKRLRGSQAVYKVEGVSDVLAFLSMPDLPEDVAAVTNSNGAKQKPLKWMVDAIANDVENVYVLHDCDKPGQQGALGWTDAGRNRPGWATEIATVATCKNVVLPYAIAEKSGADFRDWLVDDSGDRSFEALRTLAESSALVSPQEAKPNAAIDDPFLLADANLDRYATKSDGRTVRFWSGSFWIWKKNRYTQILDDEFRAKVTASVKEHLDEINREQIEEFEERSRLGQIEDDEKPPFVKKVTQSMISSVIGATKARVVLSGDCELNTWIPDRDRRNYISLANGILDVDALLADRDEVLLPHSPDWFSCSHLPYEFDPEADCPKWMEFLAYNLEGDQERIDFLQEWTGYLLLPDTSRTRFLILEGDGSNGKSVYCAGVEAMLGEGNVSHVALELFSDRFAKTETLGKLLNICGDTGELDSVAEGTIKAFTGGNKMLFDRKNLSPVNAKPTARLMIACNLLPKMRDRSDGIWRRVLIVPWRIKIREEQKVLGMDEAAWWNASGELPGIFNWALVGLDRLKRNRKFTQSDIMSESGEEYRLDSNPAKRFLLDTYKLEGGSEIATSAVYDSYKKWAIANGYPPLTAATFGREVRRVFSGVERIKRGSRNDRRWCYVGLNYVEGAWSPEDEAEFS